MEAQNDGSTDEPALVVDEILGLEGFTIKAPPAGVPLDVTEDSSGIAECLERPLQDSQPNSIVKFGAAGNPVNDGTSVLIRYRGTKARERLQNYLSELNPLSSLDSRNQQTAFTDLAEFAAGVISYLVRPKKAIENIMAQFQAAQAATASPAQTASAAGSAGAGSERRSRGRSHRPGTKQ